MSSAASTALALVALLLAVAAIVLATLANRRWARRAVTGNLGADVIVDGDRPAREALTAALATLRIEVAGLAVHVDDLGAQSTSAGADLEALQVRVEDLGARVQAGDPTALRHVALVRYDAFADVGGRLSYSVALLDDTGSGLVLTTLAGKSDVRTYVRTISAGTPDGSLTAEEHQAIEAAVGSRQ